MEKTDSVFMIQNELKILETEIGQAIMKFEHNSNGLKVANIVINHLDTSGKHGRSYILSGVKVQIEYP